MLVSVAASVSKGLTLCFCVSLEAGVYNLIASADVGFCFC